MSSEETVLQRLMDLKMEENEDRRESTNSTYSDRRRESRRISTFTNQCVLTGLVHDERMEAHRNETMSHPECPERISKIWQQLVEDGVALCCTKVDARDATEEEILYVHSKTHYDSMIATYDMPLEKLFYMALRLNSIYMNSSSIKCALLSAGSVCEITKCVLNGELDNGAAIVRPPGHHAEAHTPMGFCFFNNVAIAAKMAIEKFGINRILIVDWDVHHGNATQHMFYDDDRVLYVSLHRYDNAGFYPGSDDANYDRIGTGKGKGYNINIAWNNDKMGDAEYITAFHQIIMPVAYEYNPELVLISCGFDSGNGDPLGGYKVSPNGYAHMTHQLKALANGKLVVALEGGYNLTTISNSMSAVVQVLLGDTPAALETPFVPYDSALAAIRSTAYCLASCWESLRHWKAVDLTTPIRSSPAPVTEDTMAEQNGDTNEKTTEENTTKDRPPTPQEPTPPTEAPPIGTTPIPSERLPLNQVQKTIIEALEEDGNACMFAVEPLKWCDHLPTIVPFTPETKIDTSALCETCSTPREVWICLICHHVYCGRYINKHMLTHSEETGHQIVLSYSDLSVWCFACDSYVYNPVLFPFIKAVSDDKFKE